MFLTFYKYANITLTRNAAIVVKWYLVLMYFIPLTMRQKCPHTKTLYPYCSAAKALKFLLLDKAFGMKADRSSFSCH